MDNIINFIINNPIIIGILLFIIGITLLINYIRNKNIRDYYKQIINNNFINTNPYFAQQTLKFDFYILLFSIFLIIMGIIIIIYFIGIKAEK